MKNKYLINGKPKHLLPALILFQDNNNATSRKTIKSLPKLKINNSLQSQNFVPELILKYYSKYSNHKKNLIKNKINLQSNKKKMEFSVIKQSLQRKKSKFIRYKDLQQINQSQIRQKIRKVKTLECQTIQEQSLRNCSKNFFTPRIYNQKLKRSDCFNYFTIENKSIKLSPRINRAKQQTAKNYYQTKYQFLSKRQRKQYQQEKQQDNIVSGWIINNEETQLPGKII